MKLFFNAARTCNIRSSVVKAYLNRENIATFTNNPGTICDKQIKLIIYYEEGFIITRKSKLFET